MDLGVGQTVLNRESEEWEILEHYLMLCSRTSRTSIVQAWSVVPPPVAADAFAQRATGKQRVFCWVDIETLDDGNNLQHVLRNGITVPKRQGMTFAHGNLILPGFPLVSSPSAPELESFFTLGTQRMFHFLLCELVVGNALEIENEADAVYDNLPADFDSFFIRHARDTDPAAAALSAFPQPSESRAAFTSSLTYVFPDGGPPTASHAELAVLPQYAFRHHYVVFHSAQVCVRYVVHFEMNPCAPEYFALPLCENCSVAPAAIWCQVDAASLCLDCDKKLHETSRLAARHTRVPLQQKPRPAGQCLLHPVETCTAYCTHCRRPLCQLCLPQCVHALGLAEQQSSEKQERNAPHIAENCIVPLDVAYKALASVDSVKRSPGYTTILRAQKGLAKLKDMRADVEDNLAALEEQMHSVIGNALDQLQNVVERRTVAVAGRKMDLERQIQELDWNTEFIRYLRAVLPPQDFFSAWLKHQRYRKRILESTSKVDETLVIDSVHWASLQVDGRLEFRAL